MRTRWEQAAGLVAMTAFYNQLDDVANLLNNLEDDVGRLRARGYRYGRGWEAQVETLSQQWPDQYDDAVRLIERERTVLRRSVDEVDGLLRRAQSNHSLITTADNRLWELDRHVDEAQRRVSGVYDKTYQDARALRAQLQEVEFLLDSLESATFQLYPEENAVAATEAEWQARGTDPIEGILFLTDGRLLFEQRQEVVTKKILFIAKEKELIQELLWQGPVGGIEVLAAEDKKAFLKARQELLTLRIEGGDGPPEVTLNLKGSDNEEWVRMLRRAREGQFETERYDAPDPGPEPTPETVEAAPEPSSDAPIPTKCPSCGAQLPTIYKGMQQVTCEYCQTVVPL